MSDEIGLAELVRDAAAAGATDVLLTPGTRVGKLMVRAAGATLVSRVVPHEVLRTLSVQVGMQTGLPALLGGGETLESGIASFSVTAGADRVSVRVICTPTPAGPMVRMRLQPRALMAQGLEAFRRGDFGGLDVLPFLHSDAGLICLAGMTSGGKTSALHHVAAHLPQAPQPTILVSEACEFHWTGSSLRPGDAIPEGRVILDEMDETDKLGLALSLARERLVLATLAAPNLEAALRRLGGAASGEALPLIGVLRVGWRADQARLRVPEYAWYAFQRHGAGLCPCCGSAWNDGPCARCGNARLDLDLIASEVLSGMDRLDTYQAGARLENPDAPSERDALAASLLHRLNEPMQTWPIQPGRN